MEESNTDDLILDRREMQRLAKERIAEISKEFTTGFRFLEDYPRSVTFFGANHFKEDSPYYEDARALAAKIVKELGHSVSTGGGPGIMEAANRGAFESGGQSLGHLIQLPHEQPVNTFMTSYVSYYYFFVRKVCLTFSAEAFIFYPGGFGTFDEFFEILTLIQTKKIRGVPLVCVGTEFWSKIKDLIEQEMLRRGTVTDTDLDLFTVTDNHERIIEIVRGVPIRSGDKRHQRTTQS